MNPNSQTEDQLLTVRVAGDLVSTNAAAVRAEIERLIGSAGGEPRKGQILRLDLTKAHMIDSVGLNLVVSVLKQLRREGGKLQVAYVDDNVFRTMAFTRLDRQVELIKG